MRSELTDNLRASSVGTGSASAYKYSVFVWPHKTSALAALNLRDR